MASKNVLFAKHVRVLKNAEDTLHRKEGNKEPHTEDGNDLSRENFTSVCRTCLNRGELVPIFSPVTQEKSGDGNLTIVHLLEQSATIQVKQADDLPQNICQTCLMKLTKIYGFQKQCIINDALLKSIVAKSLNQRNHNQPNSSKKLVYCDPENSEIEDNSDGDDSQNCPYLEPFCDLKSHSQEKLDEQTGKAATAVHENALAHQEALNESSHVNCATDLEEFRGHRKTCTAQDEVGIHITEDKADLQLPYLCDSIHPGQEQNNDIVLDETSKADVQEIVVENSERRVDDTDEKIVKADMSYEKTKEFKCTKCVLTFKTREDYLIHRRVAKHTKNPLSNCEVCNKLFLRCKLKLHMRTHTKEKPYECEICLWKFNQKGNLERHMKKHNREKPYVCHLCGRGFIHSDSLENHKKKIHQQTPTKNPPKPVPRPSPYNFTCDFCGRFFKRKDPFVQHLRRHHSDRVKQDESEDTESSEEKRHTCDICRKSFKDKRGLKVHKLTHGEKQELCNVCGKSFFTQSSLKTHLRIHTGERPYTCTVCQRSFTNKTTLDSHMNTHMGVRPYGCEACGKRFTQHQHLTAHSRTHTGERPFACSYCGRSFALKSTMRVHERTHTGETPYTCEVCGKGFNDRSTRNKHRKHNHDRSENGG